LVDALGAALIGRCLQILGALDLGRFVNQDAKMRRASPAPSRPLDSKQS
jgi:hypothetical protein